MGPHGRRAGGNPVIDRRYRAMGVARCGQYFQPLRTCLVPYSQIVKNHIVPALGKFTLEQLSAQHIQTLMNSKRKAGLSARTGQYIHAVLRRALNDAVRSRLLA